MLLVQAGGSVMSGHIDAILEFTKVKVNVEIFVLKQDSEDSKKRDLLRLNVENKTASEIHKTVLKAINNFVKTGGGLITNEQPYDKYNDSKNTLYFADVCSEEIQSLEMFGILDNPPEELTDADNVKGVITGYFFRIQSQDSYLWAFQSISNANIANTKRTLFCGKALTELKGRFYQFSEEVKFILLDGKLLFKSDSTLASLFGFDILIKRKAEDTLNTLSESGLLSNMDKIVEHYSKNEKRYGKKLMLARDSPVFKIPRSQLKTIVTQSISYSSVIKFNQNNEIEINSKNDVNNLLKLLNDEILISEITNRVYDATAKNEIIDEMEVDSS